MKYVIRYREMENLLNVLVDPGDQTLEPVLEIPNDALAIDEVAAGVVHRFNGLALKYAEASQKLGCVTVNEKLIPFFEAKTGDEFYIYEMIVGEDISVEEASVLLMEEGWIKELGVQLSWRKVTVR